MAFKQTKVVSDGTSKVAIQNDNTAEAVTTSLVAYNISDSDVDLVLSINDVVVINDLVSAKSKYKLVEKLNIPASSTLTLESDTGLEVVVNYFEQAIDANAAITVTQNLVQEAENQVSLAADEADRAASEADRAENALPAGTLQDEVVATDKGWSSSKISSEIETHTEFNYLDTITSDYTANVKDYVPCDTTNNEITVTLPATPSNFNKVGLFDVKGMFDTNKVVIARNGNLIMGLEEDMEIDTKNISVELIFINGDWRVI